MYKNNNKRVVAFMLLLCSNVILCTDSFLEDTIESNNSSRIQQAIVLTAAPFTSIGSGLIGAFLSTALLLIMDKQSLIDSNIPLMFFLAGCGYGGYRGRKDIQCGELSLYSKIVSGALISLFAVGRLLVEKKTLTKTSV